MKNKSLTGIKPSGTPHIGNYLGMIKPALALAEKYQALYFIADYHALTTIQNGETLQALTYEVAATWLALGLDPGRVIFFRQSDVPELFELTYILSCFTSKGLLNRAHAYKAAVDKNLELDRDPDHGVNSGLYFYPVLMAADILLYGSHFVPVGQDQKQHIEMTRDMAMAFNHNYNREIFVIPEAVIQEEVMTIPGTDGRKMSKSYQNEIPIFAPPKALRKKVMSIVTDSRLPEESKDPDEDCIYSIYRYFLSADEDSELRARYLGGGFGYGEIKQELYERLEETFGERRAKYESFLADKHHLDLILAEGAQRARDTGVPLMRDVRLAVGTFHPEFEAV
ncbi:MAG TPA: tryptophan--tRNA ligase [Anaerolineales bacterium]|nr:tryptophan--tRNA ligase [Anaerolineales bacterium]